MEALPLSHGHNATTIWQLTMTHLMPDGRLSLHRPAEGARRLPDGHLRWDG